MFVRIVPLLSFIAVPKVLGSIEATSIVTRGGLKLFKPDGYQTMVAE